MNSILISITAVSILAILSGLILGFASHRFYIDADPIVEKVEAILPQSQCSQCGYIGCLPYAEAVALHCEKINKCVPGGEATMLKLAEILNIDPQPLDEDTLALESSFKVAWIDEYNCIGCTQCIQSCPVDAIIGTTRAVHTVLNDLCTGCGLCISPCPTDCIELRQLDTPPSNWARDCEIIPIRLIQVNQNA